MKNGIHRQILFFSAFVFSSPNIAETVKKNHLKVPQDFSFEFREKCFSFWFLFYRRRVFRFRIDDRDFAHFQQEIPSSRFSI